MEGKEVIMTYSKVLDTQGTFWTDANGRQLMKRERNKRFSFDLQDGHFIEPISSNYYPVTSGISQLQ